MSEKDSMAEKLKDELFYQPKHAVKTMSEEEINKADEFSRDYMTFLNTAKTEREVVSFLLDEAKKRGFTEFDVTKKYQPGDKVYRVNRNKAVLLAVIGKRSMREGVRIAAAHIDSPRLDLKPNPLYEDSELSLFKTHYYGGIKKYQWTAIPLSLHGVVILRDGTKVTVRIGEEEGEPKFVVNDLLPHLDREQAKRNLRDGVRGEELNILIGSRPLRCDEGTDLVKLNIMKILNEKYGMTEGDFLSAELEAVPAFPVCDIGFDRSMIGGYGHDDRVCAYPAAMAAFATENPEFTAVTVLADKEETGSDGNTGMNSSYLRYFVADLGRMEDNSILGRDVLSRSKCLSADVNAAFDPTYPDVMEKRNAAFLNHGVVVTKYTGSGGKYDTSDASAEFMSEVRDTLNAHNVQWQVGELGRVDAGGGGTVAKYIANMDVDVIDVGVPVLSMHSPFEVVSKTDVYMAYRAFVSFFES